MQKDPFWRVVEIMQTLRGEKGCPWDKKQTHRSLKPYLIEETYEVLEAIDESDPNKLKEELGDLLLQVIFHAQIAKEEKRFEISDVLKTLAEKLIRRHPHVFGDEKAATAQDVIKKWEAIKEKEKPSTLSGVPKSLPALIQARRLQEKASRVGFDWQKIAPVWEKVYEELNELKEACEKKDKNRICQELGDTLFALVNLSRFLEVDAEECLRLCNFRFKERFEYIEQKLKEKGLKPSDVELDTLDKYWEESKRI